MICQNFSEEEQNESFRIFNRILKSAEPFWIRFYENNDKKIATGLVSDGIKKSYSTELSYDEIKNRLSLTVILSKESTTTDTQVLRFQYLSAGFVGFLVFDQESQILSIRSVVPVFKASVNLAVASIFSDTKTLLRNVCMSGIIENSERLKS